MEHIEQAQVLLQDYQHTIDTSLAELHNHEVYLTRLLLRAQVHATLAVATELERQRLAGWGRPA